MRCFSTVPTGASPFLPACSIPIEGQVDVDRLPPIRGHLHTTTDARLTAADLKARASLDGRLDAHLSGDVAARLALEGPLTVNLSGPTIRYQGTFVPQSSFDRISIGTTRADFLRAVLGPPDVESPLDDGTTIWKYAYAPVEQSGSLVTLFGAPKDEPTPQPVICIIRLNKGVVIDKWRD